MSYTITVEGLTEPSTHTTLAAAVAALRTLLAELPLDPATAEAFDLFLADPDRAADYIRRDGRMSLEFAAAGRAFTAVIASGHQPDQT
ncbi:hypothetical protein [Streptomyces sp. LS1784]|uniref:hypothetical protein n=1 Tax=Streptomyces sp. LS1784 TaxID=2851533 RepID=UPI001CCF4E8E|nr:hypothetical protein [Streptomyces sp. LS1784]